MEGTEDAKFIAQIAHLGRKKVQELKTESTHFRPGEFVTKVVSLYIVVNYKLHVGCIIYDLEKKLLICW